MKSANRLAKKIYQYVGAPVNLLGQNITKREWLKPVNNLIVQALTVYAEERAQEEIKRGRAITDKMIDRSFETARNEALEEAAKVCEQQIQEEIERSKNVKGHAVFQGQAAIDAVGDVAEAIRALKAHAQEKA